MNIILSNYDFMFFNDNFRFASKITFLGVRRSRYFLSSSRNTLFKIGRPTSTLTELYSSACEPLLILI